MLEWTADTLRFRADAADYTGFDRELARRILPCLPPCARLCDAGCGTGELALALAPHCAGVTAVDSSFVALDRLRARAGGIGNLRVVQGDAFAMRPDPPYDAMVFCFFGSMDEILRTAPRQCAGKVVLVKQNWAYRRFSLRRERRTRVPYLNTLAALDALGVPYETEAFALEMGQPFRCLEDAVLFFRLYGGEGSGDLCPKDAEARLVKTDSPRFPYYLPSEAELGLIAFDAADIPREI